uniref:Uncharacterized protein n=1 Tax=Lepeophtheirus salmonis TaxID=72036 RepID=A0A0K2T8U6_LEPSM
MQWVYAPWKSLAGQKKCHP